MIVLGIDTSNYTTSAALFDSGSGEMCSERKLLTVKPGEVGLRQSEAVFQHTLQLPVLLRQLFQTTALTPQAVAVSVSPCDFEGSYMPCFLCGKGTAESIGAALHIPVHTFSHQAGHIGAALWSAGRTDLLERRFLAFHVSGGTTEAVLVAPDDKRVLRAQKVAGSLDLKAGQAVDRVGRMLGLGFPAGQQLDALSRQSDREFKIKPTLKNGCCSLSGVENRCEKMLAEGQPAPDVAKYCICYIIRALEEMIKALPADYAGLPLVFSGGVTSNSLLRERLAGAYNAVFAGPGFASDNAAGLAFLGTKL